jgi:hypothetical protein
MSDNLHPDPDTLSAFLEGVLPEHERLQCLAHLAECSHCREIVFMAQGSVPASVSTSRRWFTSMPVMAAAAVLFAVLALSLFLRHKTVQPEVVARVTTLPPVPTTASNPEIRPETQVSIKAPPAAGRQRRTMQESARALPENPPIAEQPATVQTGTPSTPVPPPPPQRTAVQVEVASSVPQTPPSPIEIAKDTLAENSLAGVSGTVTDESGAGVAQATVRLRRLAGSFRSEVRTDAKGQFKFSGLASGQYELQIASPGFRLAAMKVDLGPQQMAFVEPKLRVGSTAETVEVSAAPSSVSKRRTNANPPEPRPLPNKLPAELTVTSGKTMIAMDSGGTVFVSRNSGKSWKTVKTAWQGKVDTIRLTDPPQPSKAIFALTTDSGAIWLSKDGSRWYAAPPEQ